MKNKVVYSPIGDLCLSRKACQWLLDNDIEEEYCEYLAIGVENGGSFLYQIPRHHPLLVECIETLKDESFNIDKFTNFKDEIKIEEIDGDLYRISGNECVEWVETPTTIDWIKINQ